MTAYMTSAPANWHVEGTVLPPVSCYAGNAVVFKATSPDGSMGRYRLPATVWAWGSGIRRRQDCILANHAIGAEGLLTYYVRQSQFGFFKQCPCPNRND